VDYGPTTLIAAPVQAFRAVHTAMIKPNGTDKALHAALNLPIEQLKPLGVILSTRLAVFLYGASLRFAAARLRALS